MKKMASCFYAIVFTANAAALEINKFLCFTDNKAQMLHIVPDANQYHPQSAAYFDGNILWIAQSIHKREANHYKITLQQAGLQSENVSLRSLEFSLPKSRTKKYEAIYGPYHHPNIREVPCSFKLAFIAKNEKDQELFRDEMNCTGI